MKHSCGEKSHKCNQCKYATYTADDLTRHIKKTAEKTKPMQPMLIYIYLCKYSEETYERPINATIVNTHNLKQAICRGI